MMRCWGLHNTRKYRYIYHECKWNAFIWPAQHSIKLMPSCGVIYQISGIDDVIHHKMNILRNYAYLMYCCHSCNRCGRRPLSRSSRRRCIYDHLPLNVYLRRLFRFHLNFIQFRNGYALIIISLGLIII